MKIIKVLFLFLFHIPWLLYSQEISLDRVEPPSWWTGFKHPELQLMVHGKNIGTTTVALNYPGLTVRKVHKVANPNYLFVDLTLAPSMRPGKASLRFSSGGKEVASYTYEFRPREKGSAQRPSFSSHDVIYLVTPDRFANGDKTNDNIPGMAESANRSNKDGRHGGDLKGLTDHLDYIQDLGATALWVNPLLENDQARYSYHGYSTTDYYRIDPRFGSNADYLKLSDEVHRRGMKLIMDMIFNHCGSGHWWMKDLPTPDWINQWPTFTRTNYRASTFTDPYASQSDSNLFVRGWFDSTMPDLNQANPFLSNYLIQNSIWWIEWAGLDGIRQDTHPYPFKEMMAAWGKRLLEEYPNFNIVGECWLNYPASVAYWQKDKCNKDGYNSWLPSVFDFPLYDALNMAFREKEAWNNGIIRLYDILAQDFNYPDPNHIVTFADNHDVNRYLDMQDYDVRHLKMAMAFLLTTRGIPQVYYGTEILLTQGADKEGDGNKRRDFPGGWPGDSRNAFTPEGRLPAEADMFNYLRTLMHWRDAHEVIHTGKTRHFIPADGVYVYFRYNEKETVMVVLNNNETEKSIPTARYNEFLKKFTSGTDVISGSVINDLSTLTVPGKGVLVVELK
ncbi:MAG TPA: glycoside hydrolase family 13 protein [Bacteroidales bacterium]|nr:glycoside hydrolase family 13 protein [Bacteroidales bacterium]HPS62135.1 glycoside hydrolase family 13 protein [Bacteroidales bacterium]